MVAGRRGKPQSRPLFTSTRQLNYEFNERKKINGELKSVSDLSFKDKLRHDLLPVVMRLPILKNGASLSFLGSPEAKLISQCTDVITSISDAMENYGKTEKPLDIVFVTMIGGHRYLFATEVLLSLMLSSRGHRVKHIVCDQALPACEVKKQTNRDKWGQACAKCWSMGRHLKTSFGLDVISVSSAKKNQGDSEIPQSTRGEIVEASLLKHFMSGNLTEDDTTRERREAYQEAFSITSATGEMIKELSPDRVIMSHGIYSTWGPIRETINAAGIPVVTYGKGKKRQTIKFNWTTSADWWDVSEEWENVSNMPLTESQESEIDAYIASRRQHSNDTMVYNFGEEESATATKKRLGLDGSKLTFTAFTNVLWDAACAQREIAFDNAIEWIMETIGWFESAPDKQLIVKIHPAEVVIGTQQPFAELIREKFANLPSNVRVILPDEVINSWSIVKVTDLGIVHTSTVGMELPLEGVPVAVVSRTHFRDRGFTIDVGSKEEYFQLLQNFNPADVDRKELTSAAKKYAYLLFSRYQIAFDFFDEPNHADVRSFLLNKMANLSSSELANTFIPILEQGSGSFLLPNPAKQESTL